MHGTSALIALIALLASASGCASSSYMREVPRPARPTASPDHATVVFMRPSSAAPNTLVTIVDQDRRFLGDSLPSGCFSAAVQPGRHLFVGLGANTAALAAEIEANRIYYVEVVIRLGSVSSRAHLYGWHPGKDGDALLAKSWRDCDHYVVDTVAGQRSLREREAELIDRVRRAREQVARFSDEERMRRSLGPGDGRVP